MSQRASATPRRCSLRRSSTARSARISACTEMKCDLLQRRLPYDGWRSEHDSKFLFQRRCQLRCWCTGRSAGECDRHRLHQHPRLGFPYDDRLPRDHRGLVVRRSRLVQQLVIGCSCCLSFVCFGQQQQYRSVWRGGCCIRRRCIGTADRCTRRRRSRLSSVFPFGNRCSLSRLCLPPMPSHNGERKHKKERRQQGTREEEEIEGGGWRRERGGESEMHSLPQLHYSAAVSLSSFSLPPFHFLSPRSFLRITFFFFFGRTRRALGRFFFLPFSCPSASSEAPGE